jgi:hypothetical protein
VIFIGFGRWRKEELPKKRWGKGPKFEFIEVKGLSDSLWVFVRPVRRRLRTCVWDFEGSKESER